MAAAWPRVSDERNCPSQSHVVHKWLATYWAVLEIETAADPEPVPHHTQRHLMLWIKTTLHKPAMPTEASLRQDGAKPGPSRIFHLQEGVAPDLSFLPDARVLEEGTIPQTPWLPGEPLGTNWVNRMRVHVLCKWNCQPSHMLDVSGMLMLSIP